MWEHILILGAGIIIGSVALLIILLLCSANKPDEIFMAYKDGYENGFSDGSKSQNNHTE